MSFTHLDDSGRARMVDVTAKQPTVRAATARGFVRCSAEVVGALRTDAGFAAQLDGPCPVSERC